jgi:ankyrin repeat protein
VKKNSLLMLQLLRERGSPPNVRDKEGMAPLHVAVTEDSRTLAMLLTFAGIDLNPRDKVASSPALWANSTARGSSKGLLHRRKDSARHARSHSKRKRRSYGGFKGGVLSAPKPHQRNCR